MREVERLIEVKLIHYIRILDAKEIPLGIFIPVCAHGIHAFDEYHVPGVHGSDGGDRSVSKRLPLLNRLGNDGLIQQIVACNR